VAFVGGSKQEPTGSEQPEEYHFYNVLWVETIHGVMYRKAAGRILKEAWELNYGEPMEVLLGLKKNVYKPSFFMH
jgi:hemoglobin-like flavoprotein